MVWLLLILAGGFGVISSPGQASDASQLRIEIIPMPQCSDGLDNDGDSLIDYPDDPGCSSTTDNSESNAPDPPPPGGGEGGGGGGGVNGPPPEVITSVTFSGKAYPLSAVSILRDGQKVLTTLAGPDANFSGTLSNLTAGNYNFAIYGEDSQGRRSSLFTFPIYITAGATTNISGIFLAPTIALDKSVVKQGDNLAIFGQSLPSAQITIAVNSPQTIFKQTAADGDGVYLYNFDTAVLEFGDHTAKSKTTAGQEISPFGQTIAFAVGEETIIPEIVLKGDINNNQKVDLVDFSILAYWYRRAEPPAEIDLNQDNKIDLVDFSIMAYYWTG